jgi:hypothetical protein
MADDQEQVDAKFRDFLRTEDGQEVVVRMTAAALGYDEVSDRPRKGTYLHRITELRARFDAGELTEDQFRDEVRKLRPLRDAPPIEP